MSRSPSTTITRLRFISPGPAPQAATDAKVGTTFKRPRRGGGLVDEGQLLLVHGIGAHADAIGVQHHLAVGVGILLAEIFQRHQLVVLDRHFSRAPRNLFFFSASRIALSPCGRGHLRRQQRTHLGEGLLQRTDCPPIEPLIRQPSAATFSHKGRREENYTGVKNGSGAPSVGLNTTFTFCPIFSFSSSQSTKLVCSDGPSFSVT